MGQIVLWALLTGGITGGAWVSIVLLGNHARLRKAQQSLDLDVAARRAELARLEARLAFVESRFALMDGAMQAEVQQRSGERTPLPDGGAR
jgi:hypothetical protein